MRLFLTLVLLAGSAAAQNPHNWDALTQLKPGERVHISLQHHRPVNAEFQSFTPDQLTAGTFTASKADVLSVERRRGARWSRGKRAAVAGAIGFGGGFALGAASGGCSRGDFFCIKRGPSGLLVGGVGAVLGGAIGALWPNHTTEIIYTVR